MRRRAPLLLVVLSTLFSAAVDCGTSDGAFADATHPTITQWQTAARHVSTTAALTETRDVSGAAAVDANGGVYVHESYRCPLNAGRGDAGTQFPDFRGNGCWIVTPSTPITTDLFMIDGTGASDVTSRLQNALDAAAARLRPLSLCGRFRTSKALTLRSNDLSTNSTSGLVGCGSGGAILLTSDAKQDGVFFAGASFGQMFGCMVKDLTIEGPTLNYKTAGSAVHIVNGNNCRLENLVIRYQYAGMYLDNTALSYVALNTIQGLTAARVAEGSAAILLHGADVGSVIVSNYSDNATSNKPSVGIGLNDNVNGTYISDNSMSHFVVGFNVAACAGCKIQNIFSRQNAYDMSEAAGMKFQADGPIYRIFSVNDWSAATQKGPCLQTDGFGHALGVPNAPAMSNWQFDSFQCRDNDASGLVLGGRLTDVTFANLVSTANNAGNDEADNAGVVLRAPVSHVSFVGGIVGPTAEEFNRQDIGFLLAPGVDFITISNVDVTGNRKSPIVDRAIASTHNLFVNNPGYNPVGASTVMMGASPWTYRSGPSAETLYVRSGTCREIRQQGIVVNSSCSDLVAYQLGPNETLSFVYTMAPTIARVIH